MPMPPSPSTRHDAARARHTKRLRPPPFSCHLRCPGTDHRVSQKQVRLGLIAGPVTLQPFDHVGVQAHGDWPLRGAIELAHLGIAPVDDLRHLGKINVLVFLCCDSGDFAFLCFCKLVHDPYSWEMLGGRKCRRSAAQIYLPLYRGLTPTADTNVAAFGARPWARRRRILLRCENLP